MSQDETTSSANPSTTERPVFSLARHRELLAQGIARARAEERTKVAQAIALQANTLAALIGEDSDTTRVLRRLAAAIDGAYSAASPLVRTDERTPEQIEQYERELKESQERMRQANIDENARIEADRQRIKKMIDCGEYDPNVDPPLGADLQPLAQQREHDDDAAALALVRGRHIRSSGVSPSDLGSTGSE